MNTLVTNIRQLVTPTGAEPAHGERMGALSVRESPHILLHGDRVVSVSDARPSEKTDAVIDAAGGIVLPGLIDPFLWATDPTNPDTSSPSPATSFDRRAASAFAQILRHGTTAVEVRTPAAPGWHRVEEILASAELAARQSCVRILACFLGAPPVESPRSSDDRISALIGETIPGIQRHRLASCCAALCGEGGYNRKEARAILRAAHGAGLGVKVQASGAGGDAVLLASELEATTLDHLIRASRAELERLRQADVIPVLLPGDPFLPDLPWADARAMLDAGLAVALGSAAAATGAGILSMATVLSLAVRTMGLTLAEALTAVTLNAAAALGRAHQLGTIEPGKQADLLILDLDDYRQISDFVVGLPVREVVVGGKVACRT
ncbi:MAG: amidohydrolase family protein [Candidatus Bipolaricaulota bacterium]|nr:amidohydrolase family protein [Candidatus Bipolaricaulota bacterium]